MTNLYSLSSCPAWLEDALKANTVRPLVFLVGAKRDLLVKIALAINFSPFIKNILQPHRHVSCFHYCFIFPMQSEAAYRHVEDQATRMARALQAEYWVRLNIYVYIFISTLKRYSKYFVFSVFHQNWG